MERGGRDTTGAFLAEPGTGADRLQRPLRSRFRARLTAGVRVRPVTVQEMVLSENHTWTTG